MLLIIGSCGGGGPDVDIRIAEHDRPDLEPEMAASGQRAVPKDAAFNIAKFTSGQEGETARGESRAIELNGATCQAEVTGTGSAWGAFQLGYTFDNMSGRPLNAVVRLKLDVKGGATYETKDRNDLENVPAGSGTVNFVLKDSLGVLVRQEALYSAGMGTGARSASRRHDIVFEARLESGRGYYMMLLGRADASSSAGQSVKVDVAATNVSMEIEWKAMEQTTQKSAITDTD
ncbi:MAG TPA: hypothetical protein VNT79_09780 [Phycisphaerae bacterium]|nr:hypothetical protein [Phycisphaerae bacterium]